MKPEKTITSTSAVKSWRLVVAIVLGFSVGYLLSGSAADVSNSSDISEKDRELANSDALPALPAELVTPSEALTPREVVAIQMKALSEYYHDRSSIHQVFAHASPANRAVTGPLPKFEQLFSGKNYSALVACDYYLVGKAVRRGKVATVLATVVDKQGCMSVFRFVLSEQSESNPGCWMTDGVFRVVGGWRPGDSLPGIVRTLHHSI